MIIPFCLALSFFVADQSNAIEKPVSDRTALQRALNHARPGDTIIMAARDWTDLRLKVTRSGEQGNPITIRAQERGKVRLVGNSKLDIHGSWVVVDGLTFTDGFPSSIPIVLRAGTTHCRITNCAIVDYNAVPAHPDPPTWVSVKGTHHRIDHCSFTGRRAKTALMRVASQENPEYHRIDHNYFEALSGRALTDPYGSCCQWGGNQIVEKPQAKRPTMTGEDGRVYRALRREDVGPFGPLGR